MPRKKTTGPKTVVNPSEFYTRVLNEAGKLEFAAAENLEGLDNEITLLRVKIKQILEQDEQDIHLLLDAANLLARLVRIRYYITRDQKNGFKEAIEGVLEKYAVPLGAAMMGKEW